MGTRTIGIADYRIAADVRGSPSELPSILAGATPACADVDRYWNDNDPGHQLRPTAWRVIERGNDNLSGWWFGGPGGFTVHFRPHVVEIGARARWRGFLTIPALREVHLNAFHAIARAIGGSGILFVPCYAEELREAASAGNSFDECLALIERLWRPMQGDTSEINPRVIQECIRCPPKVWYLEPT